MARTHLIAALALLAACKGAEPEALKITGKIIYRGAAAIGVKVHAYCGDQQSDTLADSNGAYELSVDIKGCTPLVIEFQKESVLPGLRILPLPPPTSPIVMDVSMKDLEELQCGTTTCKLASQTEGRFPKGYFSRGWVTVMGGPAALEFVAGTFRDDLNHPVWLTGFGHFDFRDEQGKRIDRFPESFEECFQVDAPSQKWLVDTVPETPEKVEMSAYELDVASGRWVRQADQVTVRYTKEIQNPTTGQTVKSLVLLESKDLPDVTANLFASKEVWACTKISGSGWRAWGVSLAKESCVVFTAQDSCKTPRPTANVPITLQGRDYGFFAQTWTNNEGTACVDIVPSEPLGETYDFDWLKGETFWVDFKAGTGGNDKRDTFESPRSEGSCAQPSTCYRPSPITLFSNPGAKPCPTSSSSN